jgi:hypothetical protein
MGDFVVNGAQIKCSQALPPGKAVLTVLPTVLVDAGNMPVATIMDFKPMANIPTFGMCNSTTNPAVIAATSAASGVHTPAPCVPATTSPWSPGSSKTSVGNLNALTKDSKCMCMWAGNITIESEGQQKASVG